MKITPYQSKILKKNYLNKDIIYFQIERPTNYTFAPGQFLQTIFTDVKRSYSIFSKPSEKTLDLCIEILEDGIASKIFKDIEVGEEIIISQPMGFFTIDEQDTERTYIATGTGFAPIYTMIKTALEDYKHKSSIYLIFGLRFEENLFYQKELEELAKKYPNFGFDITLSKPGETWYGMNGRVSAHIEEKILPRKESSMYICGNPEMVKDVRKLLIDNGVGVRNIKFEVF